MTSDIRSTHQIESLRRLREWHLESAARAQSEGRSEAFQFHMRYYQLLGPAVTKCDSVRIPLEPDVPA